MNNEKDYKSSVLSDLYKEVRENKELIEENKKLKK